MDNELEEIWKEAVMAYSKYYIMICLDGLRESLKSLEQYQLTIKFSKRL